MIIEVVVAHYNGSAYIGEQLNSIQKNDLPAGAALKITVLDDLSRPEEFEKLVATCAPWPNIQVMRNERNLGVIRTFEKGLKVSQGDVVMLCDQDDIWLPHKITATFAQLNSVSSNVPALVFTNLTTVDQNLKTLTSRMLELDVFEQEREKNALLFQNIITGCTVMMNRALINFALPFPANIPMHDHWLGVCAAFAGRLLYVNEPTMLYRQHNANLVGQPNRGLKARLFNPSATLHQFRKGLRLKARQASELSQRLPEGAEKAFTREVSRAFSKSDFHQLGFLNRTNVFRARGFSRPLLSALYLLGTSDSEN